MPVAGSVRLPIPLSAPLPTLPPARHQHATDAAGAAPACARPAGIG